MSPASDPLRPFVPSSAAPWDAGAATHLLRRAGFAPAMHEIERARADGVAATVDRLVDGAPESRRAHELDALGDGIARRGELDRLRAWWLQRMRYTARPLHARLALFWHGHFATSDRKVGSPARMLGQLRTIEAHARGPFDAMLRAISRDPAMIVWLDGDDNAKGRPNENYARELFELFTLGVGHYTERDVLEGARAFTGWHQRRGAFVFRRRSHDDGDKTILGETGPFDGDDVVRIALAQPAAGRFLATKLLREFVTPVPTDPLVDAVASALRDTGFDVGETLRRLLKSAAMFDPAHRRSRIPSPVEFVIGIARSLERRTRGPALARATARMGQRLFEPPSVKGWPGHRRWLDSTTMLVRLNTAVAATRPAADGFAPDRLARRYGLRDADAARRFAVAIAHDGSAGRAIAGRLAALDGPPDRVLAAALRIALTAPEYQLA